MKGDKTVIEFLNKALRHELTAVNQYWLHYRLLDNWGYKELAKTWRKESIEEMWHADKLIERIIFLDWSASTPRPDKWAFSFCFELCADKSDRRLAWL
jgi:bacterioferritin